MKQYQHPAMGEIALADVMQALSDPCRLMIVRRLLDSGEALACNEFGLKTAKATQSHHFEVLRSAGLIETRVEGTKCLSSLRRREIEKRFPGLLRLVAMES